MQNLDINKLPAQARMELLDFYEFLLAKYAPEAPQSKSEQALRPCLGDLAVSLFGNVNGVELNLPKHPPHQPLEFDQ